MILSEHGEGNDPVADQGPENPAPLCHLFDRTRLHGVDHTPHRGVPSLAPLLMGAPEWRSDATAQRGPQRAIPPAGPWGGHKAVLSSSVWAPRSRPAAWLCPRGAPPAAYSLFVPSRGRISSSIAAALRLFAHPARREDLASAVRGRPRRKRPVPGNDVRRCGISAGMGSSSPARIADLALLAPSLLANRSQTEG